MTSYVEMASNVVVSTHKVSEVCNDNMIMAVKRLILLLFRIHVLYCYDMRWGFAILRRKLS